MKTNKKIQRGHLISSVSTLLILIILSIVLSGCSSIPMFREPKTVEKIIIVNKTEYPDMPKIYYPQSPILLDFIWSWPRTTEIEVKNKKSCLIIEDKNRDKIFWKKCGINKVDKESNLYIGLTERDYRNLVLNFDRLMAREKQWRSIIDEVNKQRKQFRERKDK